MLLWVLHIKRKGTPISENSRVSFFEGIYRGKTCFLSASEVTCVAVAVARSVACQGVVCNTVTLANIHWSLWVMRSRCMMHSWSVVMCCGLRHVTVSVETRVTMAVSALVGYEHLGVCVVEMASVVVSVHCKCPDTGLPSYWAIER